MGGGGHFTDLAVAPFMEGYFEPGGWDVFPEADGFAAGPEVFRLSDHFYSGRECFFPFDDDPFA